MEVTELKIPGVLLLKPRVFEDYRGYYMESYSKRTLAEIGITADFVQDNHFYSAKKGTIRGVHFQNNPKAQAKLVRCTKGSMLDIAVDLRKNSPTYKRYVSVELSAENKLQIYIPKGFGHCAMSLTDEVEGQYKVDELYCPELDRAIRWNDPELGIDYGTDSFVVSEKDKKSPLLRDSDVNF